MTDTISERLAEWEIIRGEALIRGDWATMNRADEKIEQLRKQSQ